jgi:hypothetical protein
MIRRQCDPIGHRKPDGGPLRVVTHRGGQMGSRRECTRILGLEGFASRPPRGRETGHAPKSGSSLSDGASVATNVQAVGNGHGARAIARSAPGTICLGRAPRHARLLENGLLGWEARDSNPEYRGPESGAGILGRSASLCFAPVLSTPAPVCFPPFRCALVQSVSLCLTYPRRRPEGIIRRALA